MRHCVASYARLHSVLGIQSGSELHQNLIGHCCVPKPSLRANIGELSDHLLTSLKGRNRHSLGRTKQRVHRETSVNAGASSAPMETSAQWSSAKGPPPCSTMLGRNLQLRNRQGDFRFHGPSTRLYLSMATLPVAQLASIPCVPTCPRSSASIAAVLSSESINKGYIS